MIARIASLLVVLLLAFGLQAQDEKKAEKKEEPKKEEAPPPPPIFKDKNLEKAVRKHVFEKRDNDKPLVEADVANLSTIEARGLGITDLTGIEKCISLAALDVATNKISDLSALKGLKLV